MDDAGKNTPFIWMNRLPGDSSLAAISIPGTHDSGAEYYSPFDPVAILGRCQSTLINEQLGNGVRFLDIRCNVRDGDLHVYHGCIDERLSFKRVMEMCDDFLRAHPTETILLSLKNEKGSQSEKFWDLVVGYAGGGGPDWYVAPSVPTLDQARGKVVLFRRFGRPGTRSGDLGIDLSSGWKDNNPDFTITLKNCTGMEVGMAEIQDKYKVDSAEAKFDCVRDFLEKARNAGGGSGRTMYLNFASGYTETVFGIPNIRDVSNHVNDELADYFKKQPKGFYGTVAMDFVETGVIHAIAESNFV